MKILFLFTHLFKGGMERTVSNISCSLSSDFEQYVGYFGTETPGFKYNATQINFDCPGGNSVGILKKIINFISRIYRLRKFVRDNHISCVISQGDFANIYSILSMHSAKKMLTIHGHFEQFLHERSVYIYLYYFLIRILYKFSDIIVAVSAGLLREGISIVNDQVPVKLINNMYPIDYICKRSQEHMPEEFSFLESNPFIINVGSFCFQKGQDDLIDMFAELSIIHPDLRLVLIGRGEFKNSLQRRVLQHGLVDRVIWIDFLENPFSFMSRAKVFVLTSRSEGFGNVLVEAMACGTPVVAFDCPSGPEEILQDGKWGVLVKNRDKILMRDAISELIIKDDRRNLYSKLGQQRAEMYSCETIVSQWEELFLSL